MTTDNGLPGGPSTPTPAGQASKAAPARDVAGQPLEQSARALEKINRPFAADPRDAATADAILLALERSLDASDTQETDCETQLYTQACLLDALFKRFLGVEIHKSSTNYLTGQPFEYIDRDDITTALRVQTNTRTTLRALSLIRATKKQSDQTK